MTTERGTSITSAEVGTLESSGSLFVPQPDSVEETGLDLSLLVDLALKAIYFTGRPLGRQLADQLALPFKVTEELIAFLRQAQAVEIVGSSGVGEQAYKYSLTARGTERAEDALNRNQYVGPTPVPFALYTEVLARQSIRDIDIKRDTFLSGLSHLVLSRKLLAALGPAVNSARSVLIYGNPGNGKSSITIALGDMLPGAILIPYAVEVQGQIIKVFDPRLHQPIAPAPLDERRRANGGPPTNGQERRRDRRWEVTRRPLVSVGGELTLEDLELRYSPVSKFYTAPLQWKANSGIFVIDDFGRQLVQPRDLLNRWIVPMEHGVDHLTLHSGDTIELPFEVLLVFSTNIPPGHLGDEAFFRRIRHKVEVPDPSREDYLDILRRVCEERSVRFDETGAQHLTTTYYDQGGREFRGCHPRDIVDLLLDITRFYGEEPILAPEWIDLACASYFVDTDLQDEAA